MTQDAMLAQLSDRKHPRYIFKRRGVITAGNIVVPIRTLDVSSQGLGIVCADPVNIGKSCQVSVHSVMGDAITRFDFSCTTVYCILSGTDGFRVGLFIDDKVAVHKQQLKRIIESCAARVI
jgi:hypothetical protein